MTGKAVKGGQKNRGSGKNLSVTLHKQSIPLWIVHLFNLICKLKKLLKA
jgi:hypothetical protein